MIYSDLITIGVPTYNRPEGLRHTLDCLLKQTYKNMRINNKFYSNIFK